MCNRKERRGSIRSRRENVEVTRNIGVFDNDARAHMLNVI